MHDELVVSRQQVVTRLRLAGWGYDRKGKHVELWRKKGSVDRLILPFRNTYPESVLVPVFRNAGLSQSEIDEFLRTCVKSDPN